jgi:hypothetical protein
VIKEGLIPSNLFLIFSISNKRMEVRKMIKISKILIGTLAGLGAATTLVKTAKILDKIIYPEVPLEQDTANKEETIILENTEVIQHKEIIKDDIDYEDPEEFDDISKAWNMQQLSRMITDFMIKNKDLDINDLKISAKHEYDLINDEYTGNKVGKNQVIEDYLVFLQILKDKKIKV